MDIYAVIMITFAGFMAVNIIIGLYGRKKASTMDDFLLASRDSSFWFVLASGVGAHIGSGVVVGTTQYALSIGMAGAWYAIGCGLSFVFHAIFMTRFIYRNNLVSFSDYFRRRYSSNFIVFLYSGVGPFASIASIGSQLIAGKVIFQAFGMDPNVGLIIVAAVVLIYTMFSGLWGSYATAVFQVAIILAGIVFAAIAMFTQGGFELVKTTYEPQMFSLFNLKPETWVLFVGPTILSTLVDQTSVQRASSARTEGTAFWGHLLSFFPLVLVGVLMALIGMWGGAMYPEAGASSFIVLMMEQFPPIIAAVMICAILAAIMSTCSGAFLAIDALVVHDLYQGFINKKATEKQMKTLNLITNVVIAAGAIVFAILFTNIIDLLSSGYTIMMSGTLIPLLGGIIWKRGTTQGAAASAILGTIVAILCVVGVIQVPFASVFPLLPALITYVIVSLCTKPTTPAGAVSTKSE